MPHSGKDYSPEGGNQMGIVNHTVSETYKRVCCSFQQVPLSRGADTTPNVPLDLQRRLGSGFVLRNVAFS